MGPAPNEREVIDLVNSKGELVLRRVQRDDDAEYDGLHMQTVIVVIVNNRGEVLVQKRGDGKRIDRGCIDHVCGAVLSGESPEDAAAREVSEEIGIEIAGLTGIDEGLSPYGRYRFLYRARSNQIPPVGYNLREVEWAAFHEPAYLRARRASGTWTFAKGFFENLAIALESS